MREPIVALLLVSALAITSMPARAGHTDECDHVSGAEKLACQAAAFAVEHVLEASPISSPGDAEAVVDDTTGCPELLDTHGLWVPSTTVNSRCVTDKLGDPTPPSPPPVDPGPVPACQGATAAPVPVFVSVDGTSLGATTPGAGFTACVTENVGSSPDCFEANDGGHTVTVRVGGADQSVDTPPFGAAACTTLDEI